MTSVIVVTKTLEAKAGSMFNFLMKLGLEFQIILQLSYSKSLKYQLIMKDLIL